MTDMRTRAMQAMRNSGGSHIGLLFGFSKIAPDQWSAINGARSMERK